MTRPTVAFICTKTPSPTRGGLDLRIESICRALSRFCNLTLICLNGNPNFSPDYCERVIVGDFNTTFQNHEIIRWQKSNPQDPLGLFIKKESIKFLWESLKRVNAQHIFVSRVATWRLFAEVSEQFNARKYLDLDETSNRLKTGFESLPTPGAELQFVINYHKNIKNYEEQILPGIQFILVSSTLENQDLEENYGLNKENCTVIKNALATKVFDSDAPKLNREGVLFPGNFSYPPNRVAMREIVSEIAPRLPTTKFTIAGSNLSKPKGMIPDNVTLISNPISMVDLFEGSSLLIAPLRFGAGTRFKIIEAMFYKLPILATKFAAEGLGLVSGTHYLNAETPLEFTEQVDTLTKNHNLGVELANAAHELAKKNFTVEAIEKDLRQLLS